MSDHETAKRVKDYYENRYAKGDIKPEGEIRAELTTLRARVQELESKVPKWVSVEDELPEEGQRVLCSYRGVYRPTSATFQNKGFCTDSHGRQPATDWMPLPTPPEDSSDDIP